MDGRPRARALTLHSTDEGMMGNQRTCWVPGTLWEPSENVTGMLWEHSGNASGMLW